MNQVQNHPLYAIDRENLDRLSAVGSPSNIDLVELARLIIRYQDFVGENDFNRDIKKILKKWNLNREQLENETRRLWSDGFRPTNSAVTDNVGSGFDTSDSSQT